MNTYQLKPASKEAMDQQILHVSSEGEHPLSISFPIPLKAQMPPNQVSPGGVAS